MKKTIAALLSALILCSLFAGTVPFASADSLEDALADVGRDLYGMYTPQSGNLLRDRYDKARAGVSGGGVQELYAALNALQPLENYKREPLLGFEGLTGANISDMTLNRGSVSVSEGAVTLSGEGTLRYCNAAREGVAGPSPFGVPCPFADGFALKIASDADAALDLEIGRRGSANDCVFTLSGVCVNEGEHYYFFPFDRFGEPPLDGTLNYISLSFTGASSVAFGDLHAVRDAAESAGERVYTETPMNSQSFKADRFYKILQRGTTLALTVAPADPGVDRLIFTENAQNDDSQFWQIVRDPYNQSRVRFINKKYALAIQEPTDGSVSVGLGVANYTNDTQKWSCSYSKAKGFSFYVSGGSKISYSGTKLTITSVSSSTKYFDILETGGIEWVQAWSDEFNTLDRSVWYVANAKNRANDTEPMFNRDSPNNVYIDNGNLVVKTIKEEYMGYHATSGFLTTEDKVQFTQGRIEMRTKLPEGRKIWPAFWAMGEDDIWPRSGEIDIVEMVGSGPGEEGGDWWGDRTSFATFHYAGATGDHVEEGGWHDYNFLTTAEKLSENYHIYAIEWENDQMRWYFDDTLYLTVRIDTPEKRDSLQENPYFLILGTGIDGPGDNLLPEGMPDEAYLIVDYIRYYKQETQAKPADTLPYAYEAGSPDYYEVIWSPAHVGAYSSELDMMVYCNGATEAVIYDLKDFSQLAHRKALNGSGWSMACALSRDGSRVIFGRQTKITTLNSEFSTLKTVNAMSAFPTVALSNDGSRCYYGGTPNTQSDGYCDYFRVFNAVSLAEISNEHVDAWVDSIAVAADDTYAYGCYDGVVRVRSASDGDLGGFTADGRVISLAFSPDSRTLYASDGARNIYAFDVASGEASLLAACPDEIFKLAVSPDGKRIAAACGDSCARVYDVESGRLAARPCLGRLAVTTVTYSLDGKLLLLGCTDGRIGVYRASDGLPLALLYNAELGGTWYHTVAISSDSSSVMAIHGVQDFNSGVSGWRLPELLSESADFSALEALPYYDETAYTSESYAAYSAALKAANAVKANPYSAQSAIDEAAQAVSEAAAALVEGGDEPEIMKGDMDKDGEITVADALAALRIAAKLVASSEEAVAIGDTDNDGEITVADALKILRVAAKLVASL